MVTKATIETVVEIDKVSGIPEFENGILDVSDYRFRKVDESSRVPYLHYALKDRIILEKDNPKLLARFEMEIAESTKRDGNKFISRGRLKILFILVLLAVFIVPIVKIIKTKLSVANDS
jgi:hypothetical protein